MLIYLQKFVIFFEVTVFKQKIDN